MGTQQPFGTMSQCLIFPGFVKTVSLYLIRISLVGSLCVACQPLAAHFLGESRSVFSVTLPSPSFLLQAK